MLITGMKQKVFLKKKKKKRKVQSSRAVVSSRTEFSLAFVACWKGSINYLTCNGVL